MRFKYIWLMRVTFGFGNKALFSYKLIFDIPQDEKKGVLQPLIVY